MLVSAGARSGNMTVALQTASLLCAGAVLRARHLRHSAALWRLTLFFCSHLIVTLRRPSKFVKTIIWDMKQNHRRPRLPEHIVMISFQICFFCVRAFGCRGRFIVVISLPIVMI